MDPIKIVARYTDGRVFKGFTRDFSPNKPSFHLWTEARAVGECRAVRLSDLKAVFFVREFEGKRWYLERKKFLGKPAVGSPVEVTFSDGEVLVGTTIGFDRKRPGFFLFPADPESNNVKVFAVNDRVANVRLLTLAA